MAAPSESAAVPLISSGIAGLDDVLRGGLRPNRLYLLEGDPGAGKTTAALQFLLAGVENGEACMFVTLSESAEELRASAESHGWSLEGVHVLEVSASEDKLTPDARYTMFHPSEVELSETVKGVLTEASRLKPSRLVFDSLSELRLLAENPLRDRRQILALKHHFARAQCTVLLVDDRTGSTRDMHLHSLAHGDQPRAPDRRIRHHATPARGAQDARTQLSRGLSRFLDPARRHPGVSAPRGVRASHRLQPRRP